MRRFLVGFFILASCAAALAIQQKLNPISGQFDYVGTSSGGGGGGSLSIKVGGSYVGVSSIAPAGLTQFTVVSGTGIITVDTGPIITLINARAIALDVANATAAAKTREDNLDGATTTITNSLITKAVAVDVAASTAAAFTAIGSSAAKETTDFNALTVSTRNLQVLGNNTNYILVSSGPESGQTFSIDSGTFKNGLTVSNGSATVKGLVIPSGSGAGIQFADGTQQNTAASGTGGGGDNFGTHRATQTIDMQNFAIAGATQVTSNNISISSSLNSGLFTISTSAAITKPLILVATGTTRLFEVDKSSIVIGVPTTLTGGLAADNVTASSGFSGSSLTLTGTNQNPAIQSTSSVNNLILNTGASSMTVTNSSVSFNATSGIALNGLGIFYTTATAINLDAFRIQPGTATVAASATLTITPPNCTTIAFPFVNQTDGSSTLGIEINSWTYGGSNFTVKNTDAVNPHPLNWMVWCK